MHRRDLFLSQLFGLQYENTIPVRGRRLLLEHADTLGVKIKKVPETEAVIDFPASDD